MSSSQPKSPAFFSPMLDFGMTAFLLATAFLFIVFGYRILMGKMTNL